MIAIAARLPSLPRIVIEFSEDICSPIMEGDDILAAQIRLPPGSIAAAVCACLIVILGVVGPAGTARAADCLTAPGASAPPNSHWYYRTDRTQQRKCWYLHANGPSQEAAVTSTQSVSTAPYSLENFKAFMAHRGNGNLSDKEVEQLYAEFLAWRRRPGNEGKAPQ